MNKKLIIGILIGAVLIFLSVRNIAFEDVARGLAVFRYAYIAPIIVIMLLIQGLRSFRWGVILSPIEKVDQIRLFPITCVGFLAITILPARVGELARPYLITKKSNITMSTALGTIFVERCFDSSAMILIFFIASFFIHLPSWLTNAGVVFLLITVIMLSIMISLIAKREASLRIVNPLIAKLPATYRLKVNRLINHLIDGFRTMTDTNQLLPIALLSLLIWLMTAAAIYILFLGFGLMLPPAAAFILLFIVVLGVSVPAAPGFIGNWHYACVLGLSLFGVAKADALLFAVIYHFLSVGFVIVLGLAFLPFNRFSLADLKSNKD